MESLNEYSWIESDCLEFEHYDFEKSTLEEIKEFYEAKKAFLLSPDNNTRYMMKYRFQIAHSGLKGECSCHSISPTKLQELTELLKKGV